MKKNWQSVSYYVSPVTTNFTTLSTNTERLACTMSMAVGAKNAHQLKPPIKRSGGIIEKTEQVLVDVGTGEVLTPESHNMVGNAWNKLHALIVKVKELLKDKWKTLGAMAVVALLLDVVTGIPGGIIGALLVT